LDVTILPPLAIETQRNLETVSNLFHLHNASAGRELKVKLNDQHLKHDPKPVYLGVDRTLNCKDHLQKTAGKLKTQNTVLLSGPSLHTQT
jgi:hypothetical protein